MRSKTAAMCLALAFTTSLGGVVTLIPQAAQAQGQYPGQNQGPYQGQHQGQYQGQSQGQRGSYDMFYRELANDGRWIDHPQHGWVWYPTNVRSDWRPYSDGRWVWTDRHGWYWQSNERFGWATEHYGRWGYDRQYGHIWVPGDEWAPAWVSFRNNDDAIGWAPLPPETLGMTLLSLLAGGSNSNHYRYVDMSDSYYQPRWTFVPTRNFTDDRVYSHAYSYGDNERYMRSTRNSTSYTTVNNYTVNRSIDPRRIETVTGRRLETVQVNRIDTRETPSNRSRTGSINVYQPQIERDDKAAPAENARARPQDKPVVRLDPAAVAPDERSRPDRDGQQRGRRDQDDKPGNDGKGATMRATPAIPATPAQPGVSGPATPATPATPAIPSARATPNDQTPAERGKPDAKPTSIKPERTATPAVPAKPAERATPPDRSDRSAPSTGATPATRATPAEPAKPAAAPQERGRPMPASVAKPDAKEPGRGGGQSEPATRGKSEERGKSDADCGKPGQAACR